MIGYSNLEPLFRAILETGLPNKIFHSVLITSDDKSRKKPSAPVDDRWQYVGVNDMQGFSAYCRVTGPMEVQSSTPLGGCSLRQYSTTTPHRLVFFNGNEKRDFDQLTAILVKAVMSAGSAIRFTRLLTIPASILQEESGGAYTFGISTFYIAIDFSLALKLQTDNCSTEIICKGLPNPYC